MFQSDKVQMYNYNITNIRFQKKKKKKIYNYTLSHLELVSMTTLRKIYFNPLPIETWKAIHEDILIKSRLENGLKKKKSLIMKFWF